MTTAASHRTLATLNLALLLTTALGARLDAQADIDGIEDREVYDDRVALTVSSTPDLDVEASLNGSPFPNLTIIIDRPNYYLLEVDSTDRASGETTTESVQFIIRDRSRGNSEWGLPPFVALPPIHSALAEFAESSLTVVTPAALPAGVDVPVVALLRDTVGRRVGANGRVTLRTDADGVGETAFELLRGVGSGFLSAPSTTGELTLEIGVGPHAVSRSVTVEASTEWSTVSGSIATTTDWGEGARVTVEDDLVVESGATLTIGAGSVVRLAAGVEVHVEGSLVVDASPESPALFAPVDREAPWGGLVLRSADANVEMTGAILTGSGADDDWFDETPDSGSSHRDEQALLFLDSATATLTDCYIIDNAGQAGHGEDATLDMTRCVIQRCVTAGQYNGGQVTLEDCALLEFPAFDAPFEDDDNDGLYLTGGAHTIASSLVAFALDDGIDAGSGSGGSVEVRDSWIESCYHEGMAWSRSRVATVRDSVAINCGQGVECGFGDPEVTATRVLSTANLVGARFGDNYDWDYDGFLTVNDSLLLYNMRDVWGRAWDNWEVHLDQMSVTGNLLSAPNENHPQNELWDPAVDAPRLVQHLPTPAGTVGIGIATWSSVVNATIVREGVPVRLSTFTTDTVEVDYEVTADGASSSGSLVFPPGQSVQRVPLDGLDPGAVDFVRVAISSPRGAEITGRDEVFVIEDVTLVPTGSVWSYWAAEDAPGVGWQNPEFDDDAWPTGPAELGYGDDDEATVIDGGPEDDRYPTVYFRRPFLVDAPGSLETLRINLRRDDGGIVWINGREAFRSNMPDGPIGHLDYADGNTSSESAFFSTEVPAAEFLRAGSNLVAVEVHQQDDNSSDVSFELELLATRVPPDPSAGPRFRRSDANGDGGRDISDAVFVLLFLFAGGDAPDCEDAADVDDDGSILLTDAVVLLDGLFRRGAPPAAPFPGCGTDPTEDELGCERGCR